MEKDGTIPASSSYVWHAQTGAPDKSLGQLVAGYLAVAEAKAIDLIDFGSVQVQGRQERNPRRQLHGGEEIRVYWPRFGTRRFYEIDPVRVLFRDDYLLAYDKEAGIPSQQTPSDAYNNLFAALYRHLKKERAPDPYIALHHRLDKETSGVMIFALDRSMNGRLGTAFEQRRVSKGYLAWVEGAPSQDEWVATDDIGRSRGRYCTVPKGHGKPAETAFAVLQRAGDSSLVWASPKTGRTHQIRLHLAACGHPVAGDSLYGKKPANRLYLHAHRLKLLHPATRSKLTLTAPVPEDWPEPRCPVIPD